MIGAAWFFEASDRTWTGSDFASVQSPEAQRFFNYLCIAFGSDPASFKFLVDQNMLPVNAARSAAPASSTQLRVAFAQDRSCRTWTSTCSSGCSRRPG